MLHRRPLSACLYVLVRRGMQMTIYIHVNQLLENAKTLLYVCYRSSGKKLQHRPSNIRRKLDVPVSFEELCFDVVDSL